MIRELTAMELWPKGATPKDFVGVVPASDLRDWHRSRWFIDDGEQLALVVRSPVRLQDPVSCTGGQGFSTVPADVEARVAQRLRGQLAAPCHSALC